MFYIDKERPIEPNVTHYSDAPKTVTVGDLLSLLMHGSVGVNDVVCLDNNELRAFKIETIGNVRCMVLKS